MMLRNNRAREPKSRQQLCLSNIQNSGIMYVYDEKRATIAMAMHSNEDERIITRAYTPSIESSFTHYDVSRINVSHRVYIYVSYRRGLFRFNARILSYCCCKMVFCAFTRASLPIIIIFGHYCITKFLFLSDICRVPCICKDWHVIRV